MRLVLATLVLSFATCGSPKKAKSPDGGAVSVALAEFSANAHVPADAQKKCKVDQALSDAVAKEVGGTVGGSASKSILLTIVRVSGAEVSWQGDITIIAEGEVADGGDTKPFRFSESAKPGVMGGMGGVCKGLNAAARLIGEDIAALMAVKPAADG